MDDYMNSCEQKMRIQGFVRSISKYKGGLYSQNTHQIQLFLKKKTKNKEAYC